ncbi:MAG: helix-turn-helix domain-containing protein [Ruminococcus sp.]|nr:helix-turn-helix domain-containing protein [Ruminococcus sp.]
MNIGKSIRQIRIENNMSQEDFAEIFFVTRQTVSNWENSKSYPDLNTIVKISDRFGVSLDRLLREDTEMVNEISEKTAVGIKWSRLRRTVFIIISVIIICLLITLSVYGIIWVSRKNSLEKNFSQNIYSLGFSESNERYYILRKNNITYVLPHQEMPSFWDFSTDFHAKFLDCSYQENECTFSVRFSDSESFSLTVTDRNGEDYYSNIDGSGLPENIRNEYNPEMIEKIIRDGKNIYNRVY